MHTICAYVHENADHLLVLLQPATTHKSIPFPLDAGSPPSDPGCCPVMTTGVDAYTLVGRGLVLADCLAGCIYTRDGEENGNQYCFGAGTLPVVCSLPGRCHIYALKL
jgi:hypothetical protein